MDVLVVDALEPDVLRWLRERHVVHVDAALAHEPRALRQAVAAARALVVPASVAVDEVLLMHAPRLRVVALLGEGPDGVDVEACAAAGLQVVRSVTASAAAEAEFLVGAWLALLRRVPVAAPDGLQVGRELGGVTVGLIGLAPSARVAAQLLEAFGARVIGYDPALHASDGVWARWGIEPLPLPVLLSQADAVGVLLPGYTRYRGLLGERVLPDCKPDQVLVSLSTSALFDDAVLAEVLGSGRLAAAWLDSVEPGLLDAGRPLHGVRALQVSPRVAALTREARSRAAWAVARRIDELLAPPGG